MLNRLEQDALQGHRSGSGPPVPLRDDAEGSAALLGLRLVLAAGRMTRESRGEPARGGVETKADGSPVTSLERDVEDLLRRWMPAFDAEASLVGEETGGSVPETGTAFAIDPIDGTRAFLAGTETYSTTFAMIRDGVPRVGVVSNPVTGEIAYAIAGRGTRLLRLSVYGEADGARQLDREFPPDVPVLVNVHPNRRAAPLLEALYAHWNRDEVGMVRSPGGSPAWALVEAARGQFAYVNLWGHGGTQPWDLAAGVLVVREAGGEVTNLRGSRIDALHHSGPFVAGLDPRKTALLAASLHAVRARVGEPDATTDNPTEPPEEAPVSSADPSLEEYMQQHGLTGDTRLYRHTLPEHLAPTDEAELAVITANADPSEAVVNVYEGGRIQLALHIGAGLAFGESPDSVWKADDRVCVEVRLQDVLDQGGRIYPVESFPTEPTWYVTLPEGRVRVRRVGA